MKAFETYTRNTWRFFRKTKD